jgi:hypothetical protein
MDTTNDAIRPTHYAFDEGVIECIDYIDSHCFDFVEGNIIKYVTRYQHKNGTEDLKKARWYLDRLIKRSEEWDAKWANRKKLTYNDILEDDEFERRASQELDAQSGPTNQS